MRGLTWFEWQQLEAMAADGPPCESTPFDEMVLERLVSRGLVTKSQRETDDGYYDWWSINDHGLLALRIERIFRSNRPV